VEKLLARHSLEIQYTDDGQFPTFSRPPHHTSTLTDLVPEARDFWARWAAKTGIDTTKKPPPVNHDISLRCGDISGNYISLAPQAPQAPSECEQQVPIKKETTPVASSGRDHLRRTAIHAWDRSKKFSFCRQLRNFGYGNWEKMQELFPTRAQRDLRALARQWLRHVLQNYTRDSNIDQIMQDITEMLHMDRQEDDADFDDTKPYYGANKKETAEFRSFFLVEGTIDEMTGVTLTGKGGLAWIDRTLLTHSLSFYILFLV
jgi:hypothetical protein